MSTKKKSTKKTEAKPEVKPGGAIPTLEAILGIEPAQQFQFEGRVFVATTVTLAEQVAYNAAQLTERLDAQAQAIVNLLNKRIVMGEPITDDEVMNLDMTTLQRLILMLQGQFRPRVEGAEGKPRK